MPRELTADLASRFAGIALGNVAREFPNKLDHVMTGAADAKSPRELHPIFYGSFDWHSCVHGYWLLARLLRRFPALPEAPDIRRAIDAHFTPGNAQAELDYIKRPESRGFERPYGLAWLLMLAAELRRHDSAYGRRWSEILSPLTGECAARLRDYLLAANYPVRAGTHGNSAFALILAMEYAATCDDEPMRAALRQKSCSWYADDADCPAWEPDGEDFLSSALTEALCMAHSLAPAAIYRVAATLSAAARGARAGNAVPAGRGQRPHRRQDRPPRRPQSQPRLVLARVGRWSSPPAIRAARSRSLPPRPTSTRACRMSPTTMPAVTGWRHSPCWRSTLERA